MSHWLLKSSAIPQMPTGFRQIKWIYAVRNGGGGSTEDWEMQAGLKRYCYYREVNKFWNFIFQFLYIYFVDFMLGYGIPDSLLSEEKPAFWNFSWEIIFTKFGANSIPLELTKRAKEKLSLLCVYLLGFQSASDIITNSVLFNTDCPQCLIIINTV